MRAASHSLANETGSLNNLLRQFKLGSVTTHIPAAYAAEPRVTASPHVKPEKSFPVSGNFVLKAGDREKF